MLGIWENSSWLGTRRQAPFTLLHRSSHPQKELQHAHACAHTHTHTHTSGVLLCLVLLSTCERACGGKEEVAWSCTDHVADHALIT